MEQNFPLYETAPKRVAVRPYQDRSWFHLADVSSKMLQVTKKIIYFANLIMCQCTKMAHWHIN